MAQPDCGGAVPACTTPSFPIVGGSGPGLVNDVPAAGSISNPSTNPAGVNSGCLLAGELNPVFITITVVSSGTLEFSMGDGVPTGCFDWAMWQVPSGGSFATGCNGIASNTLPPITCNWNGACGGYTGIASTPPTHPVTGVPGSPFDFQPTLNVNAGDQFIVCFSNYSGLTTTVPMDFFGTANVSCNSVVFTCPGTPVTLTGPAGGSGYSWSPAGGLSSTTGASVTATVSVNTSYTLTYTNALGAVTNMTYDVMMNPTPTPNYTFTPENCDGDDSAMVAMNPVGTGPFTYTLNGSAEPDGTFFPLAPGLYNVQVTDANGCVGDTIVNVTPGPSCCTMVLNATSNPSLCPGGCSGDANVAISGLLSSSPVINWLNSVGAPIGINTPTASSLCAGTYFVEVVDSSFCTLYDTVTIVDLPGPSISSVTFNDPLCAGNCNGDITITATGATQYSINGGLTFQPSGNFTGLCNGTYQILVENANGCQATAANVTLLAPVALTINEDLVTNVTCNGFANGAIAATIVGGTAPFTISWSNGAITEDVTGLTAGSYTVTITDNNGCSANMTSLVTEPSQLVMSFSSTNATCYNYCDGTASTVVGGGTAPYSYNWSGLGSSTSVSGICDGVYDLIVTDANGCTISELDFVITEPAQINIGSISVKHETCFGSCDGRLIIPSTNGTAFSIDGGTLFFTNNTFIDLCEGVYSIVVKDDNGCFNTASAEVLRPLEVTAEFSFGPQPTDFFETEIDFNNLSLNGSQYMWTYDSLGFSTAFEEIFEFPQYVADSYLVCLRVMNDSGCVDTVCHDIIIDDYTYLYLPNAFTPNADGMNDIFQPIINYIEEGSYVFQIFNRWGELFYQTNDPKVGWDGTHKNIKAKEDVYVWKIRAKSQLNAEKKEWVGHVTLMR